MRKNVGLLVVASLLAASSAALAGTAPTAAHADVGTPRLKHVWVIQLENKSYDESFVNRSNTYLWDTLPRQGVLLREEYGTGHNSLDNYISQLSGQGANAVTRADCPTYMDVAGGNAAILPDAQAGTVAGINAGQDAGLGCVYPTGVRTLANQLVDNGQTWHGYMGDLGNNTQREQATCGLPATAGVADDPASLPARADDTQSANAGDQYAARHNPFVYFHAIIDDKASCQTNVTPLTDLAHTLSATDDSNTPNFNYVTPNLCDDAHDAMCVGPNLNGTSQGGLFAADLFLQKYVPMITSSAAFRDGGMLVVDFDEGNIGEVGTTTTEACCGGTGAPNVSSPALGGGLTGAVIISPFTTPGTISYVAYNHYSLLRSLEDGFGITSGGTDGKGHLGYAAEPVGDRVASTDTTAALSPFVPYGCDVYSAVGGGCGTNNPALPESALAISLPLVGLAGGAFLFLRRRRRA